MSLAQWQAVIDVNLTGVFLCGREAAERMIKLGNGGVIINIASISKAGNAGQSNYSAAKSGVAALAVTWAKELARFGIRAAAIAPGFIRTDLLASMPPEMLEKVTAPVPLKRLGLPEEIAHTALLHRRERLLHGSQRRRRRRPAALDEHDSDLGGDQQMQIQDVRAIVTGGASGLGLATAEMIVRGGGKVALFDVNEQAGAAAVQALGSAASLLPGRRDVRSRP